MQEVIRALLEPYYEQRFSHLSPGFRPLRGCHSALRAVSTWQGTIWFIEGDIKGCVDTIDPTVLLEIIQRDIHDGRMVRLIDGLLRAVYMEDWQYHETLSGTPQGGIISPLLGNIYLNDLDRYVEDTLIPAYTRGRRRRANRAYMDLFNQLRAARKRGDEGMAHILVQQQRQLPANDGFDPDYRRLRYLRYAYDVLLGFAGPKQEAEAIRERLAEFLEQRLKLSLSMEKTLITQAVDEKAKFLGYEITAIRSHPRVASNGKRAAKGCIALLMPREAVSKLQKRGQPEG